ncbi:MAG TPA: RidA family protein [Terriglobia bacterium]|jgi:2-iminobutanoate/2-iminopropanoate deaminase|nr:RidA family protein [Terriglobia bacterium]
MTRRVIKTTLGPQAVGAYSQAIAAGNLVFVSGQIALDPATGNLIAEKDIKSQTRRVLLNLQGVLQGAGVSLGNVVRTTVFLKDMSDFADFNGVYAEFFNVDPPARSTVEVARLPKDVAIEIDCIAMTD